MSDNLAFELVAQTRQELGKAAVGRLRKAGSVPATVYGTDKKPVSITLKQNEVMKALGNEAIYSNILDLKIDNNSEKVVLKALQRHVTKPMIMHMDFLRIDPNDKITMQIPLHFINEETCAGVKKGGLISHLITSIDVKCLPTNLPQAIDVDVSALDLNHPLHLTDIKLPAGVEFATELNEEHNTPIISANAAKEGDEEGATEEAPSAEDADAGDTKES